MTPGPLEQVEAVIAAESTVGGRGRIVAVGWATVELDRAAVELAAALGSTAEAFIPAGDSTVLGARCRVLRDALPGGIDLAIVEPATEARLAAWLARHGEGPTAVWFAGDGPQADMNGAVAGPFGAERLDSDRISNATRCWLLIVREAGTIDG